MATKLQPLDRDTPMLLPPDLRDWVPANHIVHFILDAVDRLPQKYFHYNERGSGSAQYPPRMMFSLLIYAYITSRFSSRVIEQATYSDVVMRYICGGSLHPDHDTICTFRRENRKLFREAFVEVLLLATELGGLKQVGTVSVDGTKIKANASRHSAVSYAGAARQIEMLQAEVKQLEAKAEEADSTPLEDGLSLPEEIQRRSDRIDRLKEARALIEERYKEEGHAEKKEKHEACKARRDAERAAGKKPKGREPKEPTEEPPEKMQVNFTDPESRIMKTAKGYEQSYNAQAGVDTESMLVVEEYVTEHANDKRELPEHVDKVGESGYEAEAILADSGYYSEEAIEEIERNGGPTIYAAQGRKKHGRTVEDMEKREDGPSPSPDASLKDRMKYRMQTKAGRDLYRLRKQTVEPVFGIIKSAMGFRQMSMRGKEKAETEWTLVCLSYNVKRLFNLSAGVCSPHAEKS